MTGWPGRLRAAVPWVPRLFLLQLGWLCHCLAGGIVLGIAPATNVLAAQLAKYLAHPDAAFEWRASWRLWRGEFWSSQLRLGVPLAHGALVALCLWLARGTFLAAPAAIFAFAYATWLLLLPAAARLSGDPSALVGWRAGLVMLARVPIAAALVSAASAAALVLGVAYSPAAVLAFGISGPLLGASLVAMRYARTATRAT
ncbi:MAG TPA: DUF624 domain-containing protein [Microbacterium sp.]|uniref:DUF624 domain-containing protein n=1 Tax=unclassified Microbacterium TaxID=2609290 RepID=UPI000E235DD6